VKQEGIEQALGMFRTTLERGYKFVLCVEANAEASNSKLAMTQTNHTPAGEAKMLAKFARQSAKRAKDW
jgi:hypothetical protein